MENPNTYYPSNTNNANSLYQDNLQLSWYDYNRIQFNSPSSVLNNSQPLDIAQELYKLFKKINYTAQISDIIENILNFFNCLKLYKLSYEQSEEVFSPSLLYDKSSSEVALIALFNNISEFSDNPIFPKDYVFAVNQSIDHDALTDWLSHNDISISDRIGLSFQKSLDAKDFKKYILYKDDLEVNNLLTLIYFISHSVKINFYEVVPTKYIKNTLTELFKRVNLVVTKLERIYSVFKDNLLKVANKNPNNKAISEIEIANYRLIIQTIEYFKNKGKSNLTKIKISKNTLEKLVQKIDLFDFIYFDFPINQDFINDIFISKFFDKDINLNVHKVMPLDFYEFANRFSQENMNLFLNRMADFINSNENIVFKNNFKIFRFLNGYDKTNSKYPYPDFDLDSMIAITVRYLKKSNKKSDLLIKDTDFLEIILTNPDKYKPLSLLIQL